MTASTKVESRAGLWAAGAVVFAPAVAFELELVSLTTLAAVASALFLAGSVYALQARPPLRHVYAAVSCVVLTLVVQVLPEIVRIGARDYWSTGIGIAYALLGWAWVFVVLGGRSATPQPIAVARPHHVAGALTLAAFVSFALVHWALRADDASIVDEVLYVFQAENLRRGAPALPLDPSLAPFFSIRQAFITTDGLHGQYTPGWPAVLAVFDAIGLRWWATVVLATVSVWCTYLLGAAVRSRSVGVVAAAVLTTSYWFVFSAGTYYSTVGSVAFCTLGALLLVSAAASRRPLLMQAGAGAIFGIAFAVRPLTAVAVGLSAYIWTTLRARPTPGMALRASLALAVGAAVPIGATLWYNAATTGSALTFGYAVSHAGLQALGFGLRGQIHFAAGGQALQSATPFEFPHAVAAFAELFREVANEFLPACLWAGVLLVAWVNRVRLHLRYLPVFALLPAAHFFYWYANPRFYAELLPYAAIGMSILLVETSQSNGRAARAMLAMVLAGNVLFSATRIAHDREVFHAQFAPSFEAVEALARERGNVLLFVRDGPEVEPLYEALWWFNAEGIPGRIVVARDLGPRNADLIAKLPSHYPVRLEGFGNWVPTLEPVGAAR